MMNLNGNIKSAKEWIVLDCNDIEFWNADGTGNLFSNTKTSRVIPR